MASCIFGVDRGGQWRLLRVCARSDCAAGHGCAGASDHGSGSEAQPGRWIEPVIIVDGTVIETTPTTVSMDVLVARTSSVFQDVVIRDTVRLETLEIQSLMARKFSPAKTALVTIGIGLAAYGAIKGIDQVVGGTDDPGGPGDPNIRASRRSWVGIPVLRFGTGR